MKLNELISFYKILYIDLSIDTINTETFKHMLEFDILVRFNHMITKDKINIICEALIKNNIRSIKHNGKNTKKKRINRCK